MCGSSSRLQPFKAVSHIILAKSKMLCYFVGFHGEDSSAGHWSRPFPQIKVSKRFNDARINLPFCLYFSLFSPFLAIRV